MHVKNLFRYFLVIFTITIPYYGHLLADSPVSMAQPAGSMYGGPVALPSDLELQQINAEIDKFVRSLPPEQQEQFYKDVETLTAEMEKMSPDQLDSFVSGVFTEAGLMEPMPMPSMPETESLPEVAPTKEEKPVAIITTAPSGPTEKALAMLDAIISNTEAFLRKAQIMPELPGKMDKWVVQKKLQEVTAKLDWETVQRQIEELNALIHTLKEKDPKTGEYRHIGNLIKDEALYNNLAKLQVTLQAYVPTVQVPEFGLNIVSKESRAAMREILSQYIESFYLLNVPEGIKKLEQLYDPRAKELSDEEKLLAEKAKKESQRTRRQSEAVRSYGTDSGYYDSSSYGYDDYYGGSSYGGYSPSSYSSYSPSSYSSSDYSQPSSSSSSSRPSSRSSSGTAGAAKADGAKEEKDGTGAKDGKKADGKDEKAAQKPAEVKKDDAKDDKLKEITSSINDVTNKLKEFDPILSGFKVHLTDPKGFDAKFVKDQLADLVISLLAAHKKLEKATTAIKSFKKSLQSSNKPTQDHYKKKLVGNIKDATKFYANLHDDLKFIINEMYTNPAYRATINADKRYVYFGEDSGAVTADVKKSLKDDTASTDKPLFTMQDLFNVIDAYLKEAR